jgi:site-specific recombinase XerD
MSPIAPALQKYFTVHAVQQRGLSPNTIASYRDTWRLFIKHLASATGAETSRLDLGVITPESVTGFLAWLETSRGNQPATRNARLTAVKAVIAQAVPDHPEHADTLRRVLAIPARRTVKPVVTYLTPDQTDALLAAPSQATFTGRRDRALLTLAAQTGLRATELLSLTIGDVRLASPAHVVCTGKGRKQRVTPLTKTTAAVIDVYLQERSRRPGPALFPNRQGQALSRDALEQRLAVHLATATTINPSLANKHITMHTLRHTAAMRLLETGTDPAVIALWLGHESIATTSVYLHADMTAKQAAIDKTRPSSVQAGRYQPQPDILAWLDAL